MPNTLVNRISVLMGSLRTVYVPTLVYRSEPHDIYDDAGSEE